MSGTRQRGSALRRRTPDIYAKCLRANPDTEEGLRPDGIRTNRVCLGERPQGNLWTNSLKRPKRPSRRPKSEPAPEARGAKTRLPPYFGPRRGQNAWWNPDLNGQLICLMLRTNFGDFGKSGSGIWRICRGSYLITFALSFLDVEHALFCCYSLSLPALTDLALDLRWHSWDDFTPFLKALVATSADGISLARVQNLTLRTLGMSFRTRVPIFKSLFDHFPLLEELHLDFRTLHHGYWRAMLEASLAGRMPRLRALVVAGISANDVQEYVCSRLRANLAKLDVVIVAGPRDPEVLHGQKYLTWLRAKTRTCTVLTDASDTDVC